MMITATARIGREQYKTEVSIANHTLIADEMKGTDLGPEPPQFLQVALASCTAITLRMYANHKNLPLEKIKVDVTMEKLEWKTLFKREIELTGELTPEQRNRLLEIANACPVHKTLMTPIEIDTHLSVAAAN
ncbi:MAG TPA: OsmC family protein [Cyclobacteriaceae bacterium]